jgi:hypothetical protein
MNSIERINTETGLEKIKTVLTEVELPREGNPKNDCGPLSIEMLALTDLGDKAKELNLERLRNLVGKTKDEGTMPGNICNLLKDLGYGVKYYSTIDWKACTVDPSTSFDQWDKKIRNLPPEHFKPREDGEDEFINLDKMRDSAEWLEKNPEILSYKKLKVKNIEQLLSEGKRIIAIVGGNHYVVITGIDGENIYFNNPTRNPAKESLSHERFYAWWESGLDATEAIVATPPIDNREVE